MSDLGDLFITLIGSFVIVLMLTLTVVGTLWEIICLTISYKRVSKLLKIFIRARVKRHKVFAKIMLKRMCEGDLEDFTLDIRESKVNDDITIDLNISTKLNEHDCFSCLAYVTFASLYLESYNVKTFNYYINFMIRDGYGNFKMDRKCLYTLDKNTLDKINWMGIKGSEFANIMQNNGNVIFKEECN